MHELDNLKRLKRNLDNAYTFPPFTGEPPVGLLSFLQTFKNGCALQGDW